MQTFDFDKQKDEVQAVDLVLSEWDSPPEVFHIHHAKIDKLLKAIIDLEIYNEASCRLAVNAYADVKAILKEISYIKSKTVHPYKSFINKINESAKMYTDKLEYIEQIINDKINGYETLLATLPETVQNSFSSFSETLESDIELIAINSQKIASTSKTIVTHKTDKDFTVEDKALIPLEYMCVDEAKIKKAIKSGITNIPGISIIESKKIVLRSR